jgi:hypothetical protein
MATLALTKHGRQAMRLPLETLDARVHVSKFNGVIIEAFK